MGPLDYAGPGSRPGSRPERTGWPVLLFALGFVLTFPFACAASIAIRSVLGPSRLSDLIFLCALTGVPLALFWHRRATMFAAGWLTGVALFVLTFYAICGSPFRQTSF